MQVWEFCNVLTENEVFTFKSDKYDIYEYGSSHISKFNQITGGAFWVCKNYAVFQYRVVSVDLSNRIVEMTNHEISTESYFEKILEATKFFEKADEYGQSRNNF